MVRFNRADAPRFSPVENGGKAGAPRETRTPDLRFRKPIAVCRGWPKTKDFREVQWGLGRSFGFKNVAPGSPRTEGKQLHEPLDRVGLLRIETTRQRRSDPDHKRSVRIEMADESPIHDSAYAEERSGVVYFIRAGRTATIKIGWAKDPYKRLDTLQTGCPHTLHLIGYAPGERQEEQAWHETWRSERGRGEWFSLTTELRHAINRKLIEPGATCYKHISILTRAPSAKSVRAVFA